MPGRTNLDILSKECKYLTEIFTLQAPVTAALLECHHAIDLQSAEFELLLVLTRPTCGFSSDLGFSLKFIAQKVSQ